MGVKGLWQVLDSEGILDDCQIELSSLRGKILAVDVSIWLYQFVKSVPAGKDSSALSPFVIGGLFQRVCKLLHYGIKPIFVFDGSAPTLKKETVAARQEFRKKGDMDFSKLARKILKNKLKLMALEEISGSKDNDFIEKVSDKKQIKVEKAPPIDFLTFLESPQGSEEEDDEAGYNEMLNEEDYDDLDTSSLEFKKLPFEIQEQILLVSRKRTIDSAQLSEITPNFNSPESPKKGDSALDFSKAQVEALIKRRKLMDELEVLRGNSVKKGADATVFSHGKIASSSDKKYIFAKNAQAGWSLSLINSKDEEVKYQDDVTSFAKPEVKKESTISDIDDDNEFMSIMFGDSSQKPEIPNIKKMSELPVQLS